MSHARRNPSDPFDLAILGIVGLGGLWLLTKINNPASIGSSVVPGGVGPGSPFANNTGSWLDYLLQFSGFGPIPGR